MILQPRFRPMASTGSPGLPVGRYFLMTVNRVKKFLINIFNEQVVCIDMKGDTVAIAFPEEIKKIAINGIDFYHDKKGWLEGIADAPYASLVVKRKIIIRYEKEGALGISDSTGGIDSFTTFISNNTSYHLYVNDDAVLKKLTSWFLLMKDGRLLPASKVNFLKQFPKIKKNTEAYLSKNKVNFNKEQDWIQLRGISCSDN
jgi:hypothetical protein